MSDLLLTSYMIYLALFMVAIVGSVWWLRHKRKSKLPFDPKTERLLRSPGEGARKKMDELTDKMIEDTFAAFLTPLLSFVILAAIVRWLKPSAQTQQTLLIEFPILCLLILCFFVYRISCRLLERSDWRLGQFGERNVADHLDPLSQRGWRVFHDVPAENKGKKFNLDHVIVGPGGVFVIETKTPRRPEIGNGREEHVVVYNGESLRWPTGMVDYKKPRIAQYRAEWLLKWLKQEGLLVHEVVPLLAIPWWYVDSVGDGPVQAVHPGQLVGIISSYNRALSDQLVTAITARLELRCRDVEY